MFKNISFVVALMSFLLLAMSCSSGSGKQTKTEENLNAKHLLQGIWLDSDGEDVAFRIKGDSVYFPDSTSAPAYFRVERDSFVIYGGNTVKYHIVKQSAHVFSFINQNGEKVKLFKTTDESYLDTFAPKTIQTINQNKVLKRDTVMYYNDNKYHCYVQINPTTYKVYKASTNNDGLEVDNVFYDNIINLCVYNGGNRLYSCDFNKNDFKRQVPQQLLSQAVLSDITFKHADAKGLHFCAVLVIPETSISYMVKINVGYDGGLYLQQM